MQTVVLAYSGSLETSAAIPWLKEHYQADVIALMLDLGQGRPLDRIRERALACGAIRAHVLDVRDEFARDLILPALQAGALDGDPLATALSRPLIARTLVEVAGMEQATSLAHGSTGADRIRLDELLRAIAGTQRTIAVASDWGLTRAELIAYAKARGIAAPSTTCQGVIRENLWGRSIERGELEDPEAEPSEEIYARTKSPAEAPAEPASVELEFDRGVPSTINGIAMPLTELIASLETIAGVHGVGRIDVVHEPPGGVRSRRIAEAPAAVVLRAAHHALETLALPGDLRRLKRPLSTAYADLVDAGRWFTQARTAIDAFVADVQQRVTGAVRLRLWKGNCQVVELKSPFAVATHRPDTTGLARPEELAKT